MTEYLKKRYALSEQGAKDLIKSSLACTASDIILIFPVGLLYLLAVDLIKGVIPAAHYYVFGIGCTAVLALIYITSKFQYNATFFTTYRESGARRIALAEKLRRLPLSFFGKKDLADLTTTIMGDCATLETAFSHWFPQFFGAIASTCIVAVNLFLADWRLAAASLWVLPAALIIVGFSHKVQNYFSAKKTESVLACADGIQECIETLRDLKANNAEERYLEGLYKKIDGIEKSSIIAELGVALFVMSSTFLLKFGIATTALVGGWLIVGGDTDIFVFFMYLLVVSRIYEPMAASLQNLAAIISTDINIDRMKEIEKYKAQTGTAEFNPQNYDIVFDDVRFSYNSNEPVLKGVSFTAKQGEITALIGPSGGGKTTASRLAARFWDIDSGKITVGGIDVSTIDPEKLLSVYSIVFQDVTLFNNTVMENIRIGRQNATDAEVLAAAEAARCAEFVKRLPNGYNTMIGENGSVLSGGERQRISIARAFLKNAPIILLDEATASLDTENETLIQQALSSLIKGKTVLIIAHRMRTVSSANKIVVLKEGVVAEEGSPDVLKHKNGIYCKMLMMQEEQDHM